MKDSVYFEQIENNKIFCYFSEPDISTNKLVIMSHGFRGSSIGPARAFVDFARILNQNGFSVLRFDQPNSGNSDGDYVESSFNEWVKTIVYFAEKYINKRYEVLLMGQSMGASATVVATNDVRIKSKIPKIILWVPDPKSFIEEKAGEFYEEQGQKYDGRFWAEAKESNFFRCLKEYEGKIHLVYGENDKFVVKEDIDKVIAEVRKKNQPFLVLSGQDHSSWDYDVIQEVYKEEIKFIMEK